jgi:pseudoazurin
VTLSKTLLCAALLVVTGLPDPVARAAEHVVHLMSEGAAGRFLFEPPVVFAATGDTVRFVPDDGMHAVKAIKGMLPDGAAAFRGRMGEEVVVKLDRSGVYGVKCRSSYDIGMVGLIVVGEDPPNFEAAQKVRHPPAASMAFAKMFDEAGCRLHLSACEE